MKKTVLVSLLGLLAWLGGPGAAPPSVAAPGARTLRIEGIRVSEADGRTTVVISTSGKPTFTTFKLDKPSRVVVDVSNTRLGEVDVPFEADTFALGAVSANASEDESGARTRLYFAMRRAGDYAVKAAGNDIVLVVTPQDRPPDPGPARADIAAAEKRAAEAQRAAEASGKRASAAEAEAEAARRLADEADKRAEAARLREEERGNAARDAQAQAEAHRRALEAKQAAQEEHERKLGEMEKLVGEREQAVKAAQQALAGREKAFQDATSRRVRLERSGGSKDALEGARLELRKAEQARLEAVGAAQASRKALIEAEMAMRRENQRRKVVEAERADEERKWQKAEAERKAIESKRVVAEEARKAEEDKLAKAETEKRRLESQRTALEAEISRLRGEVPRALARSAALSAALASASAPPPPAPSQITAPPPAPSPAARIADAAPVKPAAPPFVSGPSPLPSPKLAEAARSPSVAPPAPKPPSPPPVLAVAKPEAAPGPEAAPKPDPAPDVALPPTPASIAVAAAGATTRPSPAAPRVLPSKVTPPPPPKLAAAAVPPKAQAPAPPRPVAPPPPPLNVITLSPPSRVQRVDFFEDAARYTVRIDLDSPAAFAPVERSGTRRLVLRLLHAELPRGLQRTQDATEYLGPVRFIHSQPDPIQYGIVQVVVDLAEDVPQKVRQEGSTLYWEFGKPRSLVSAPVTTAVARTRARSLDMRVESILPVKVAGFADAAAAAAARIASGAVQAQSQTSSMPAPPSVRAVPKKRYTGRRIDLDFKNADIHNLLRLLADIGQVNVVTSEDVRGEVTIKMKNVPWDQALDVVLRAKQLGQVREGNLIRVAPLAVLEKEIEQEIARQKQLTEVLPTETRLIGVSYAEASKLEARAKDLLSPRGKISVDDRTNHLIVTDVQKNLALIEELVRNLDTQTSQVVIEARIVEARSTFVKQFGIQWGFTGFEDVQHGNPTGLVFPHNVGVAGGADDSSAPLAGLVPFPRSGVPGAKNPNFAVNLPVAAGTGTGGAIGITMGSLAGAFNLNLRLTALESSGNIRILSSPRVSTMDNVSASIGQGVSIPISVVSAAGAQTVFVDAKLDLQVKPHVTNEGTVILDVQVTRNEPDFVNTGARGDPTILKKDVKTVMLVKDGDTAVIGGIYTRNSGLNFSKVPFFADLPLVGFLFRNRRENDDRTEFLIFITPRISNRARAIGQ